jgi:hypothetical protein
VQQGARGPSQEGTSRLYSSIEQWWGEELTASLAEKASSAPADQIEAFLDELDVSGSHLSQIHALLDEQEAFLDGLHVSGSHLGVRAVIDAMRSQVEAFFDELDVSGGWALPDKQPGILRPLVGTNGFRYQGLNSNVALRLLLYVPEVALEREPLDGLFELRGKRVTHRSRKVMRLILGDLADLRPFVYQGIVSFTLVSPARHPGGSLLWEVDALANPAVRDLARQLASDDLGKLPEDRLLGNDLYLATILRSYFAAQKMGMARMSQGTANPLSRTEIERQLLSALLYREIGDGRYSLMSTLAQLPVPDFSDNPKLLVQLRNNDEKFNAWRQKLGAALSHVGELPDSADLDEASAIVKTELLSALSDVERSTKQSTALQAARQGVVQFGVSAVGAVSAGLATGNPVAGLIGGASTQLAQFAVNYLKALRAKRSDRLVLSLAALFDISK